MMRHNEIGDIPERFTGKCKFVKVFRILCVVVICVAGSPVRELLSHLAGFGDSTKLDKIGGNWHKLGLMRVRVLYGCILS